jgi:hypothetical protein
LLIIIESGKGFSAHYFPSSHPLLRRGLGGRIKQKHLTGIMKLKIKNDRFTETSSAQAAVLLVIARHEAIKGSTPKSRGSKDKRVLIPEAAH